MYDPKFEKGVRQKMEGLEFIPSESVWANVQKAVADQRRRRGGYFFWRIGFSAILLAGIVGMLYHAAKPTAAQPVGAGSASPASVAAAPTTGAPSSVVPSSAAPKSTPAAPATTSNPQAASPQAVANLRVVANHQAVANDRRTGNHRGTDENGVTANHRRTGESSVTGNDQPPAANSHQRLTADVPAEAAPNSTSIAPYLYQPQLTGQRNAAAIKAAMLSSKTTVIALSALQKTKRPWEAGFVAGGGISRLNRLNISNSTNQALSANLYNIASAAAAPSKNYVADVRPDASFMAGIYLQKGVSSRWTINLGMNLHYYSTRISIGEPVSTYVPVTVSLIAPTVVQSAQTSTAYIAGDKQNFTNHYYFLELPVNMQYRLNKSKMLPLFVEGGFSLSRLMGSDALFYNAHSGVYYKDPAVLQKTQVNISTGLMVGLPFHGIRIEAGPQVQYGLTPLINNHSQGDQHFLYTGLRVVILPGRK